MGGRGRGREGETEAEMLLDSPNPESMGKYQMNSYDFKKGLLNKLSAFPSSIQLFSLKQEMCWDTLGLAPSHATDQCVQLSTHCGLRRTIHKLCRTICGLP